MGRHALLQGVFLTQGIEPTSSSLQVITTEPPGKLRSYISYRNFLPRVEADPKKKAPWTSVAWVAGGGPLVAGTGNPRGGLVGSWLAVLGLVSLFLGLLIT